MSPSAQYYPGVAISISIMLFSLCLFLFVGCGNAEAQVATSQVDLNTTPHLITRIDDKVYGDRTAHHPDGRMYFLGDVRVSVIDGVVIDERIPLPNLAPPYGQLLRDIGVEPDSGMVYVLDNFTGAIHVISNTVLITTLLGVVEQPLQVVADEDSGEMYIFYTSQKSDKPQARVAILSEAEVITDIVLPVFSNRTARYNPVDGHIYVIGYAGVKPDVFVNALTIIDNHQVITTILLSINQIYQLLILRLIDRPEISTYC